ncbi:hypothetical protein GCM10022225_63950 [Plantactinospora mayteni]|uniref:Uncharacterized protein n=1 Tax=Plantactinospora mayteni TaxID=566021 RepID=A0ABQ4F094_9ACTN|nr:hypothetical protein Pma05_68960 [Plantactinospora mayteni]
MSDSPERRGTQDGDGRIQDSRGKGSSNRPYNPNRDLTRQNESKSSTRPPNTTTGREHDGTTRKTQVVRGRVIDPQQRRTDPGQSGKDREAGQ